MKLIVCLFALVLNPLASAETLIPRAMKHPNGFKLYPAREIEAKPRETIRAAMAKFGFERLPAGAITVAGLHYDYVYADQRDRVVLFTNVWDLEDAAGELYSLNSDFMYYGPVGGQRLALLTGDLPHHDVIQLVNALRTKDGTVAGLERLFDRVIPRADASETASSLRAHDGATKVFQGVEAQVAADVKALGDTEKWGRAFTGCLHGFYDVYQTLWGKPVGSMLRAAWSPRATIEATKGEVRQFKKNGMGLIKDFFRSAYANIANFGNWPIEKKNAFWCQFLTPGLVKAYVPKIVPNAPAVMDQAVVDALKARAAEPVKPPSAWTQASDKLWREGIDSKLADELGKIPEMVPTYRRLTQEGLVGAPFQVSPGSLSPVATTATVNGVERLAIRPDGRIAVTWTAENFYGPARGDVIKTARTNLQNAVLRTRQVTGNDNYRPDRMMFELRPNEISVSLAGTEADYAFLRAMRDAEAGVPASARAAVGAQ